MNPEPIALKEYRNFKTWLTVSGVSEAYKTAILQYYLKYFRDYTLTTPKNLISFLNRQNGSYRYCVLTLRAYLRFLNETNTLPDHATAPYLKVLKLNGGSDADNYIPTQKEVKQAYLNITNDRIKLYYEVLTYSGIRITELQKLFSEYDPKRMITEENFAKYPLNYIRGQKKIFYVYLPLETAKKLKRHYRINSKNMTKVLGKSGLNPKYLRKYLYNYLIYNNVPESVADFIEGRATQTVGSLHYLSKTKQADFWYAKVVDKLTEVFK